MVVQQIYKNNPNASPQKVYESKVELANELDRFNNVTPEQAKALGDFLEYLFLIDNEVLDEYTVPYKVDNSSKRDDILENLALLGDVPFDLKERINTEKDINTLKKWIRLSVKAESIEEFVKEACV